MLNRQDQDSYPGPNASSNWRATARFTEGFKKLRTFQGSLDRHLLDEAEKLLLEAVAMDPAYEAARFHLGVAQELEGRHEDAARQFEELLAVDAKPQTELLYNAGLSCFHQYRDEAYTKAEDYLLRAAVTAEKASGEDPTGQTHRAMAVLAQAVLAQVYSHRAILREGEKSEQFKSIAEGYYQKALGTADEALKAFDSSQTVIERLDPEFKNDIGWGIHNALGHAKMYAARRSEDPAEKDRLFQAALAEFKEALKFYPNNIRVLSNIGSAKLFGAQGQTDPRRRSELLAEAEREFERVLALQPDYDFAFCRLAQIEVERRNFEAARKYAELAEKHPSEMKPQYIKELKSKIENEANSSHIEGNTYFGKVVRLADFGAFVEIFPGTDGLLHISEVAEHRISDIRDELKLGDQLLVKVISVEGNKVRLSRKAVLREQREKSAEPGTRSEKPGVH
jgi:predicted RNA-binding protein with RPS1 domain